VHGGYHGDKLCIHLVDINPITLRPLTFSLLEILPRNCINQLQLKPFLLAFYDGSGKIACCSSTEAASGDSGVEALPLSDASKKSLPHLTLELHTFMTKIGRTLIQVVTEES
jgi:hypothetical protein